MLEAKISRKVVVNRLRVKETDMLSCVCSAPILSSNWLLLNTEKFVTSKLKGWIF